MEMREAVASLGRGNWQMKNFPRIFLLFHLLLLLLAVATAEARTKGYVAGNIRTLSGIPLSNAVIKVFLSAHPDRAPLVARSNHNGFFTLPVPNAGEYYLQVSHPRYQPVTTDNFFISAGQKISLDVVLREFFDYISNDEDPRNWELKTLMRSTSDRRLIFRNFPAGSQPEEAVPEYCFTRSGSMSIASDSSPHMGNYWAHPQASQTGVTSNFAWTEPLSRHSRIILSGQFDFGSASFWRLRNTYNYRPDNAHDYRISLGYGRLNINYLGSTSVLPQLLSGESQWHQPAVETLALGLKGSTRFMEYMTVKYGFDYSRLHYGASKSFFYPSLQILITPVEGWSIKAFSSSQRLTDTNSIVLPDGEILNLSEPTIITMVDNHVSMSQVRHAEISTQKTITQETTIEFAVYQDRAQGAGLPFLITTVTPLERKSQLVELGDDRSSQKGMRLIISRNFLDFLTGSIAYGYGTTVTIPDFGELASGGAPNGNFLRYTQMRYQHALTGRIDAIIPVTGTKLRATMRWYPGNPLTPIDWFSDRMDFGTRSTNFEIRQSLPLPEFIANTGQLQLFVDLRNILNQGKETITTADGEIILNANPRSLRFGLSLNF